MGKTFRGGVPYAVDVRRLTEAFPGPSLTEGRTITHAQLEEIVSASRASQRYYGVIHSWMARMKNANGIFIIWQRSVGLKVLSPAEILGFAGTKTRQKIGQLGKAVRIYGHVDRKRLDTTGQQRFDHETHVLSVLEDAARAAKKEMPINLAPIRSLPKPAIMREA